MFIYFILVDNTWHDLLRRSKKVVLVDTAPQMSTTATESLHLSCNSDIFNLLWSNFVDTIAVGM